ncbi:uncharacterized protein B0H18DRAFT_1118944 [Fomitopsis serialis]|uniref:uncharacterized protein n=1 Tax=Fomitopsis serialis TaxID=139415 RepID=UPI00200731A5|nr:uncharacterized protein B0H18DRAFT_1118944 [Neoantrodia serialis]KAH9926447.1 hypothetical protein B0H18DRAFT_1118944 [Neoantrodia serialis]
MGVETLNEDTLTLVVSYLGSVDAHRLSSTARLFHGVARVHALKDVTIHSFPKVIKFCDYMLQDGRDRLSSLRALRIQCFVENEHRLAQQEPRFHQHSEGEYRAGAGLLADLLQEIPDLRVLVLHQAEVWMMYERRIVTVVSAMRRLDELGLTDIGPQVSDTLHSLQSAPRKLALADAVQWSLPHNSVPHMWRLDGANLSFPSVRSLLIRAPHHLPAAPDLARIFPNTRELDFGELHTTHFPVLFGPQPPHARLVDWPSLEVVRATGFALKWWKNAHPVHCLELLSPLRKMDNSSVGVRQLNPAAERDDALMAVANVQPVALIAILSTRLGDRYLRQLFTKTRRLRYVSAEIWDVHRFETWLPDLNKWWSLVRGTFSRYPPIVCLKVRCSVLREPLPRSDTEQTGSDPTGAPATYAEALEAILAALPEWATSVPTLRYVSLDLRSTSPALKDHRRMTAIGNGIPRPEDDKSAKDENLHWWQIEGDGDGRVAQLLAPAQGERIAAFLCSSRYDWQTDLDAQPIV